MAWLTSYVIAQSECERSIGGSRWWSLDLHVRLVSNLEHFFPSEEEGLKWHDHGELLWDNYLCVCDSGLNLSLLFLFASARSQHSQRCQGLFVTDVCCKIVKLDDP